jgi:hypothetical protein
LSVILDRLEALSSESAWKANLQTKMPDINVGCCPALVDVQQKLNCALRIVLFELWFLSIPKSSRHVRSDDQLIHPRDLAVDLSSSSFFQNWGWILSLERR